MNDMFFYEEMQQGLEVFRYYDLSTIITWIILTLTVLGAFFVGFNIEIWLKGRM